MTMCLSRCMTAAGNKMRLRTTEVQKRRCVVRTNQHTSWGARVQFASFIVSRRSLACVLEHEHGYQVRCFFARSKSSASVRKFTISWFSPYSPENFHNGAGRYEYVWYSYNVEEVCPLLRTARVFQMPFSSINLCMPSMLGRDCLLSYRIATSIHNWTRRSTSCPNVLTLTWRSPEVSA